MKKQSGCTIQKSVFPVWQKLAQARIASQFVTELFRLDHEDLRDFFGIEELYIPGDSKHVSFTISKSAEEFLSFQREVGGRNRANWAFGRIINNALYVINEYVMNKKGELSIAELINEIKSYVEKKKSEAKVCSM